MVLVLVLVVLVLVLVLVVVGRGGGGGRGGERTKAEPLLQIPQPILPHEQERAPYEIVHSASLSIRHVHILGEREGAQRMAEGSG